MTLGENFQLLIFSLESTSSGADPGPSQKIRGYALKAGRGFKEPKALKPNTLLVGYLIEKGSKII